MNQKDFKKTINEILTEGKIEGKDIKNIDIQLLETFIQI